MPWRSENISPSFFLCRKESSNVDLDFVKRKYNNIHSIYVLSHSCAHFKGERIPFFIAGSFHGLLFVAQSLGCVPVYERSRFTASFLCTVGCSKKGELGLLGKAAADEVMAGAFRQGDGKVVCGAKELHR